MSDEFSLCSLSHPTLSLEMQSVNWVEDHNRLDTKMTKSTVSYSSGHSVLVFSVIGFLEQDPFFSLLIKKNNFCYLYCSMNPMTGQ